MSRASASHPLEKPWLPPLGRLVGAAIDHQAEWTTPRQLSIPLGMLDLPRVLKSRRSTLWYWELGNTESWVPRLWGKSTALQISSWIWLCANTPEQVQFNLFDLGRMVSYQLEVCPHVADLVRLDEEEKLLKYLKRLDSLERAESPLTEDGV